MRIYLSYHETALARVLILLIRALTTHAIN